ncbi:hypothetical protein [Streptomyces sp. NPDC002913]
MTGPEHYREAERLVKDEYRTAESIAAAQVHATLALAAATALIDEKPRGGSFDAYRAWESVAGGSPAEVDPLDNVW